MKAKAKVKAVAKKAPGVTSKPKKVAKAKPRTKS
jgi:hypothetical protein